MNERETNLGAVVELGLVDSMHQLGLADLIWMARNTSKLHPLEVREAVAAPWHMRREDFVGGAEWSMGWPAARKPWLEGSSYNVEVVVVGGGVVDGDDDLYQRGADSRGS